MFGHIILEPEQVNLLYKLVEAVRNTPKDQRQKFMLLKRMGGASLHHPGLKNEDKPVYEGDLEILAGEGLLNVSFGGKGTPSYDVTPLGFKYYEYLRQEQGTPLEKVEESVNQFINGPGFIDRYQKAYKKWAESEKLLWATDSEDQLTTIGHLCREAVQEFATELIRKHNPPGATQEVTKTVGRIRAVLDLRAEKVGSTMKPFLEALLAFWGTTNDLIQRQEHGAQKEGEPLVWEDGRRVVFSTAVVMVEIDRALM